ncbi:tRNA uracil 4-sulfurtransferase ThiI [Paenibacillus chungangensis]|uniref:Probable tRNA sulfurtransferase n=1 Tax=Paenibacillus chungangensis TaxID=696535 RepID=A0ABW3HXC7_9BACL
MIYDQVVLRYGDLTMKGRNRNQFENKMVKAVKQALIPFPNTSYWKTYGRMYVKLNGHPHGPVIERLKELFGIVSVSPVVSTEPELEAIRNTAMKLMQSLDHVPKTFKMNVRRAWKKFAYNSQEMNHLVAQHVLPAFPEMSVDVRHPELELRVDIQEEAAYIYWEVVPAAGGFPFGSNGKGLLLLSGGIDSPVAGWMAMRKGLELEAIHFHSYPFTSEQAKDKVVSLAKRLTFFSATRMRLHIISFTDIQTTIAGCNQEHLTITLMRRAMLRIAQGVAEDINAGGLVTGESLGQVASQTLASMNVIGRATELPLLKPLIMMDKNEIIRLAERIGTYETSILPYEDCCTLFLPKSPSTNPNLKVVERVEGNLASMEEMIMIAIRDREVIHVYPTESPNEVQAGEEDWF